MHVLSFMEHAQTACPMVVEQLQSCRESAKKASLLTESSVLDPTKEPLKLPAFEQAVMIAVTKALEAWRDEALEGARANLLQLLQKTSL